MLKIYKTVSILAILIFTAVAVAQPAVGLYLRPQAALDRGLTGNNRPALGDRTEAQAEVDLAVSYLLTAKSIIIIPPQFMRPEDKGLGDEAVAFLLGREFKRMLPHKNIKIVCTNPDPAHCQKVGHVFNSMASERDAKIEFMSLGELKRGLDKNDALVATCDDQYGQGFAGLEDLPNVKISFGEYDEHLSNPTWHGAEVKRNAVIHLGFSEESAGIYLDKDIVRFREEYDMSGNKEALRNQVLEEVFENMAGASGPIEPDPARLAKTKMALLYCPTLKGVYLDMLKETLQHDVELKSQEITLFTVLNVGFPDLTAEEVLGRGFNFVDLRQGSYRQTEGGFNVTVVNLGSIPYSLFCRLKVIARDLPSASTGDISISQDIAAEAPFLYEMRFWMRPLFGTLRERLVKYLGDEDGRELFNILMNFTGSPDITLGEFMQPGKLDELRRESARVFYDERIWGLFRKFGKCATQDLDLFAVLERSFSRQKQERLIELTTDWINYKANEDEIMRLACELLDIKDISQFKSIRPVKPVILAAGKGERFREQMTADKNLVEVDGVPTIIRVLDTINSLSACGVQVEKPVVIVSPENKEDVKNILAGKYDVDIVIQERIQERARGTGDAVFQAREHLEGYEGDVLVTFASQPVVTRQSLLKSIIIHQAVKEAAMTVPSTIKHEKVGSQGRGLYAPLIRDENGAVVDGWQSRLENRSVPEIGEDDIGVYIVRGEELMPTLDLARYVLLHKKTRNYTNPHVYHPLHKSYYHAPGELGFPNEMMRTLAQRRGRLVLGLAMADPREAFGIKEGPDVATAARFIKELSAPTVQDGHAAGGIGIDGNFYEDQYVDATNKFDSISKLSQLYDIIKTRVNKRQYDTPLTGIAAVREIGWLLNEIIALSNCSDPLFKANMPPHLREMPGIAGKLAKELNVRPSAELLIAAMLHDADRFFDGYYVMMKDEPSSDSPCYKNYYKPIQHPRMAAEFVRPLLEALGIDKGIIERADVLIRNHETGLREETAEELEASLIRDAEILRDADAISVFTPILLVNILRIENKGRIDKLYLEVDAKYNRCSPESRKIIDNLMAEREEEYRATIAGNAAYEVFLWVKKRGAAISIPYIFEYSNSAAALVSEQSI